ncbi:MAG: fibrobacter succinogenes major paralogous domain-containing protein [Flavobacteriales bacterium]
MKNLLLILLCLPSFTSFGQVLDYDGNDDGCVNIDDALGLLMEFGQCLDVEVFVCGETIEHQDYDYSTVQIGEQCWFSENCRYLPVVSHSSLGSSTEPYYYVYGYEGTDLAAAKATENYETYGVLYNWPAVMTEGICPSGWHIPSDGEFTQLTDFLGGESVAGGKMKDDVQWDGSNSSGWTGLPGGYRYSDGFNVSGHGGHWWSASESGSYSWKRRLLSDYVNVFRNDGSRYYGFSARCVRDD